MSAVRSSVEVELEPAQVFDIVVEELGLAGIQLDEGRALAWEPGCRILLDWQDTDWEPHETTEVELRFEPIDGGTRVSLECRGWERVLGDRGSELAGWFAGEALAPLLEAISPARYGDWLTDRRARRPSGLQARGVYADPLYHYPNFAVIHEQLELAADDLLLEVGCGGGAFLRKALESGCRVKAVDHSPDMVRLARATNRDAVAAGRLEVVEASADRLPFADGSFTCAVMTGVLGFLPDAVGALAEIRRVLAPGGRFVALGSDPALRGTPAAPEPMASRLRFYEDDELERLGRDAGFTEV
ncbi:MAG TPA: methyltransferase domain-containing protein, partial [Gaiellaceae bacterium]